MNIPEKTIEAVATVTAKLVKKKMMIHLCIFHLIGDQMLLKTKGNVFRASRDRKINDIKG